MSKRNLLIIISALLAVVLAGSLILSNWWLNPGPLSPKHAHVKDCKSCHTNIDKPLISWLHGVIVKDQPETACLTCHQYKHPFKAHNLPERLLATQTEVKTQPLVRGMLNLPVTKTELPCNQCHTEHKGHDTAIMKQEQATCNACHQQQITSFAKDHPEFNNFPDPTKYTRLKYDHVKHEQQYFAELEYKDRAVTECKTCHVQQGKTMVVTNFATSCGSCHADEIKGQDRLEAKGITIFTLPGLDLETLQEHGVKLGQWPEYAEAELSPFLEFILSKDPQTKAALHLVQDLDWLDLSDATDNQLDAIAKVVWQIKTLFGILGHGALVELAESNPARAKALKSLNLPEDTLKSFLAVWLPDLDAELAAYLAGEPAATRILPEPTELLTLKLSKFQRSGEQWARLGGWYCDGYAILYRPLGHMDPLLHTWLNTQSAASVQSWLRAESAPGLCLKCHVETKNPAAIDWQPMQLLPKELDLFQFDHQPHVNSKLDNCDTCHKAEPSDTYLQALNGKYRHKFISNFAAISMKTCSECHNSQANADNCLLCHQYHQR